MKNKQKSKKEKRVNISSAKLKKLLARKDNEQKLHEALSTVPKITNETVSEHREEVLGKARKYIYPLKHSKTHFVRLTISLSVVAVVAFFVFCVLDIYKFQSTSAFIYRVSEVVPFPVAKAGSDYVSYYNYLFELRRNMHYYSTQQQANFSTKSGQTQLDSLKKQAMNDVITLSYTKQLARKHHVYVSQQDVNSALDLVKAENRLGTSNAELASVLKDYWGWTENDFKQELKQELLEQKVVAVMDSTTNNLAQSVYQKVIHGGNFSALAGQYSQDPSTKSNGGQYPETITPSTTNIAPQVMQELYKLKVNQVSPIINTGYSLEILKVLSRHQNQITAAHIQFNYSPITQFTNKLEKKSPPKQFISF